MWSSALLAILAAVSTGVRFYVDRRTNELISEARRVEEFNGRNEQLKRENELRLKLEDARVEQQAAAKKLREVEAIAKGRRLTPDQIDKMTKLTHEIASLVPEINVTAANSNSEAQEFALDFVKAFKAAGCVADLALPIPGLTADVRGIHIGVRDINSISDSAALLSAVLQKCGIEFSLSPLASDFLPGAPFVLVVGGKH